MCLGRDSEMVPVYTFFLGAWMGGRRFGRAEPAPFLKAVLERKGQLAREEKKARLHRNVPFMIVSRRGLFHEDMLLFR